MIRLPSTTIRPVVRMIPSVITRRNVSNLPFGNPISSGPSSNVDDNKKYDPAHAYPKTGQFTQSNTVENPNTGRPIPLNVELTKYAPMKHPIIHGDNVCDLQVRSFFTPDLDFFCNFVLRIAFFLNIPVKGVTPLPRKTERWTVIKSPFAQAKSKENFERRTHKRLIKLYDANPDTIQIFLAAVRKFAMPGVGMKATIYQHEDLDVLTRLDDVSIPEGSVLSSLGDNLDAVDPELADAVKAILDSPEFKPLMEEHEAKKASTKKSEVEKKD